MDPHRREQLRAQYLADVDQLFVTVNEVADLSVRDRRALATFLRKNVRQRSIEGAKGLGTLTDEDHANVLYRLRHNERVPLQYSGYADVFEYPAQRWVVKVFTVPRDYEDETQCFNKEILYTSMLECVNALYAAQLRAGPTVFAVVAEVVIPDMSEPSEDALDLHLCMLAGSPHRNLIGDSRTPVFARSLASLLRDASHSLLLAGVNLASVVWLEDTSAKLIDFDPQLTSVLYDDISYACALVFNCVTLLTYSVRTTDGARALSVQPAEREMLLPVAALLRQALQTPGWERDCYRMPRLDQIDVDELYPKEQPEYWFQSLVYYMQQRGTLALWMAALSGGDSGLGGLAAQVVSLYLPDSAEPRVKRLRPPARAPGLDAAREAYRELQSELQRRRDALRRDPSDLSEFVTAHPVLSCERGGTIQRDLPNRRSEILSLLDEEHIALKSTPYLKVLHYTKRALVVKTIPFQANETDYYFEAALEGLNALTAASSELGPAVQALLLRASGEGAELVLCSQAGFVYQAVRDAPAAHKAAGQSLAALMQRASRYALMADLKGDNVVWLDGTRAALIDLDPQSTEMFPSQSAACVTVFNCVMLLAWPVKRWQDRANPGENRLYVSANAQELHRPVAELLRDTLSTAGWRDSCLRLQDVDTEATTNPYQRGEDRYWYFTMLYYMRFRGTTELWDFAQDASAGNKLDSLARQLVGIYLAPRARSRLGALRLLCPWG
jgi:hypothetical protein